jgi:hypothetical protein
MVNRPTYFEWRVQLEAEAGRWRLASLALTGVCLALIAFIVYQTSRPVPVYFFAGTREMAIGGLARADEVPPELVEGFASQVAMVFGNLMPQTARQSYDRMRLYMVDALIQQLATQAAADLRAIEERQLSTSFTVQKTAIVSSAKGRWTVRVAGRRMSWARGMLIGEEDVAYEFDVVRARASHSNPSGLAIARVEVGRPPAASRLPGETDRRVASQVTHGERA